MDAESTGGLPDDRELSREIHESALRRKRAKGSCEACGADSWGVGDQLLLVDVLDAERRFIPGHGVEVVSAFCKHCGLLRLHAASLLLRDP